MRRAAEARREHIDSGWRRGAYAMRPRAAAVRRAGTLASTATRTRRAARTASTLGFAAPRDAAERTHAQQEENLLRMEAGNLQADAHAGRDNEPDVAGALRTLPTNPQTASRDELRDGISRADAAVQVQVEQAPPIVAELAKSGLSPEEITTQTGLLANFVGIGEILEEIDRNPNAMNSPAVRAELAELQDTNRQLLGADTPGLSAEEVRMGRSGLTPVVQGEATDPSAAVTALRSVQDVIGAVVRQAGFDPDTIVERFTVGPRETPGVQGPNSLGNIRQRAERILASGKARDPKALAELLDRMEEASRRAVEQAMEGGEGADATNRQVDAVLDELVKLEPTVEVDEPEVRDGQHPGIIAERFAAPTGKSPENGGASQEQAEEKGGLLNRLGKGLDAAKEFAGDAVDGAKEFAADTADALETNAQKAQLGFRGLGTKVFNAAEEFVDDMGDELREGKQRFELVARGAGGRAFNDAEVKLDELGKTVQQAELGMRGVISAGVNATDAAVDEALGQLDVLQRKADAALAEGQMSVAHALYDAKLRLEMVYLVQKGELLNTPEAMFQWAFDNTPEAIKKWHYEDRHDLNKDLPAFDEAESDPLWKPVPDWMNEYHQDGVGKREIKYVHKDGREVIYNGDTHEIVTDERIFGTFNRVVPEIPPKDKSDVVGWLKWLDAAVGHYALDVAPFYILGNARPKDAQGNPIK